MNKRIVLVLVAIVVCAAALRLYKLADYPPGLTWDEAALGYNAYSLLVTGADEYGARLPLTLKSFGDYKPAMYAYFAVPSVAIFDLTEFAVRLPNALFGIAAIGIMFFIARRLFENDAIALICAAVLAFSPWHIHFSRGAWEVNTALTIIMLGLLFFLKGLDSARWFVPSVACFALSVYTYQSSRLFVPLLGIGLVSIYFKRLWPLKPWLMVAAVTGLILLIPFMMIITDKELTRRLTVQNLFSYSRPPEETAKLATALHMQPTDAVFGLFHSQNELWGRAIIEREINYLSPSYLFVTGDTNFRHRTPGVAHGYWIDIIFYVAGFFVLLKLPFKHKAIIFWWLVISPLPAALSRDSTQALRSLHLVIATSMLIALGLWYFFNHARKKRFGFLAIGFYLCAFLFTLLFYLDSYYIHMPARSSQYWLTHYKQAISRISNIYNNYDQVVFTTDYNEPYIYLLFYLKVDPKDYQQQAKLSATRGIDVGEVEAYNHFRFRHIYWPDDRAKPKTLFIGSEEELPDKDLITEPRAQLLDTIKFANGMTALKIVETE